MVKKPFGFLTQLHNIDCTNRSNHLGMLIDWVMTKHSGFPSLNNLCRHPQNSTPCIVAAYRHRQLSIHSDDINKPSPIHTTKCSHKEFNLQFIWKPFTWLCTLLKSFKYRILKVLIQIYLKVEAKTANVRRASEAGLTRQTVQFITKTEFDIEILHIHPKVESRHTESFKSA